MKSITQYGEILTKLSEFVKQLDEHVRAEAFNFLLTQECNRSEEAAPPSVNHQPNQRSRAVAPQELIRKCAVTSFSDKALILAYWLEEFQQKTSFSIGDLKNAFEQAREQLPKNPSDMVIKLEGTAKIMKGEKVGAVQHYSLTATAIHEIEGKLKSENEVK